MNTGRMGRRAFCSGVAAAACAPVVSGCNRPDASSSFPSRPIHIVVPYGAGGGVDTNTRAFAPHLSKELGVEVVVENREGGGGVEGHSYGASANADGYTLTMASSGLAAAPWTVKGVEVGPADFAFIGQLAFDPNFLIVSAKSPYKTVDDLVEYGKGHPGKLSIGKVNGWPSSTISLMAFVEEAKLEVNEVSGFSGGASKMASILAGRLDFSLHNTSETLPNAKAGKIRVLGVSSPTKSEFFPDVPTLPDLGYDVDIGVWRTLAAPKDTPKAVTDKLVRATKAALERSKLEKDFKKVGLSVGYLPPKKAKEVVMGDHKRFGKLFKRLGVSVKG